MHSPEWEGFQQRAAAVFAWQQVLRPMLPRTLNSELRRRGRRAVNRCAKSALEHPVTRDSIREAIRYNVERSPFTGMHMNVYVFATLPQCDAGLENLGHEAATTQVALSPQSAAEWPDPSLVRVRFELLLTQADDVSYAEYYVRMPPRTAPLEELLDPVRLQQVLRAVTGSTLMLRCAHCTALGVTMPRCSGCKAVHYCSKECQNVDWERHREECVGNKK